MSSVADQVNNLMGDLADDAKNAAGDALTSETAESVVMINYNGELKTIEQWTEFLKTLEKRLDVTGDQKFDWKDVKVWLSLIGTALLIGLSMALYINRTTIWEALITGQWGQIDFWGSIFLSSFVFAVKAGKYLKKKEVDSMKSENIRLTKLLQKQETDLVELKTIIRDMHVKYQNQLFFREVDLAGKCTAIETKDEIARDLIEKYDTLKSILDDETLIKTK